MDTEALTAALDAARGQRRALGRLLSSVETHELTAAARRALEVAAAAGQGHPTIGITGAPGVGKSVLVERLVQHWTEAGERVAVLAIDPSSPISGGALLGDRVRMTRVDEGDDAYLRSVATRGEPGALPAAVEAMRWVLQATGWQRVLIETVGAGQAELRVAAVADRLLVVEGPARGDVVQAEKAGLLELADVIAVNKADLAGAEEAAAQLRHALEMGGRSPPPVLLCSAKEGHGIEAIAVALEQAVPDAVSLRARQRERLLGAWSARVLSLSGLDAAIDGLLSGAPLEAAVDDLLAEATQAPRDEATGP